MWREKIKNLLFDNQVDRPFCKRLLDKLGGALKTSCPRGCGVDMFALVDRKEHADFCALGVAKCLRCGKSVVRKDLQGTHRKACEGRPGMRRWPMRPRRRLVGKSVVLGSVDSDAIVGEGRQDVEGEQGTLFSLSTPSSFLHH